MLKKNIVAEMVFLCDKIIDKKIFISSDIRKYFEDTSNLSLKLKKEELIKGYKELVEYAIKNNINYDKILFISKNGKLDVFSKDDFITNNIIVGGDVEWDKIIEIEVSKEYLSLYYLDESVSTFNWNSYRGKWYFVHHFTC